MGNFLKNIIPTKNQIKWKHMQESKQHVLQNYLNSQMALLLKQQKRLTKMVVFLINWNTDINCLHKTNFC